MVAALLAVAAVALATAAGGGTTGTVASAAAKPKWLTIPGFWDGVTGPSEVGSASGRGWLGFPQFPRSDGDSLSTLLGSLHRVRGKLSFAKVVLTRSQGPMMIVDPSLVYHLPDVSGTPGELRTAPLLANGSVGNPRAVADDPEKIPPQDFDPVVADGIQVGDRFVWVLTGSRGGMSAGTDFLWACCSTTGELSGLTRLIQRGKPLMSWQLGLDAKGRLWLAWLQRSRSAVVGSVKLLELDLETLAPRTPKAMTLPGGSAATRFELSCAAFCRVVMTDLFSGDLLASSPGQRSPTRMASGTRDNPATLLAASDRSGHLTAAYITSRSPDPAEAYVHEIEVVVGDARGSHPRRLATVDLPDAIGPSSDLYQTAYATFVPGGLVYFAFYYPGGTKTRVLAGFLPLRR